MHKHILIATDGSDLAQKAGDYGLDLAAGLGARVSVLAATDTWSVFEMAHKAEAGVVNPLERYEQAMAKAARSVLDDVAARAKVRGVSCETIHAADQQPAQAIVDAAQAHGCDLIVMGSHGRSGLSQLLIGSQAAKVLALSKIPVLIYR